MQGSEDKILLEGEKVARGSLYAPRDYETDVKRRLRHLEITVDKNEVELSKHILGNDKNGNPFSLKRMATIINVNNTIDSYVELRNLFCRDRGLPENSSATIILEYLNKGGKPIEDGFGGGGKTKKLRKSKKRKSKSKKSNRKSRKSKRRKTRRKKR